MVNRVRKSISEYFLQVMQVGPVLHAQVMESDSRSALRQEQRPITNNLILT
jgi:hypothetical protein